VRKLAISVLLLALCELVYSSTNEPNGIDSSKIADSVWLPLVEQINEPQLDSLSFPISSLVLKRVDFSLSLDSGTLFLFEPVSIQGKPIYYGGYFVGQGQFRFKPRIKPERFQVERFYESDSVFNEVNHLILFFRESAFPGLSAEKVSKSDVLSKEDRKNLDFGFQTIRYKSENYSAFMILKNILHPQSDSFLFVHSINGKFDHDLYVYNPLDREEVTLGKAYPEWDGVELVCSYNRSVDETLFNINGPRRDAIYPLNYEIETSIDLKGMLRAEVTLSAKVIDSNAQFLLFFLHPEIDVESVEFGNGQPIEFLRDKSGSIEIPILYLFLPQTPAADSPLVLKFRYHGKITKREYGLYYVDASTHWYPRFNDNRWSHFNLRFKSPKDFSLVASATLVDSSRLGDTLFTHWRTARKEKGITFNIAGFEIHSFSEKDLPKVEVYHNKPLHEALFKGYQKDWHKNVSSSILDIHEEKCMG
jgi:hypothetical protein